MLTSSQSPTSCYWARWLDLASGTQGRALIDGVNLRRRPSPWETEPFSGPWSPPLHLIHCWRELQGATSWLTLLIICRAITNLTIPRKEHLLITASEREAMLLSCQVTLRWILFVSSLFFSASRGWRVLACTPKAFDEMNYEFFCLWYRTCPRHSSVSFLKWVNTKTLPVNFSRNTWTLLESFKESILWHPSRKCTDWKTKD